MSAPTLAGSRPSVPRPLPPLTGPSARRLFLDERGAATAEYAIATMAAVAFAGLLVVIMRAQLTKPRLVDTGLLRMIFHPQLTKPHLVGTELAGAIQRAHATKR